ncbi:MAG TPA: hypothetical protein VJU16_04770 [Planctomycetota bacterium]|nr:hypothetical protein [Planctomycetota bacterium]
MKPITISLITAGFVALVIAAVVVRSQRVPTKSARPVVASQPSYMPKVAGTPVDDRLESPQYEPPPPPASPDRSAEAIREQSVRSTLTQYRSALDSGSRLISKKLLDVLRKNQAIAIRVAEKDLSNAVSDAETRSLKNALEAIRR